MSRTSPSWLLLATLAVGIILGMAIDRGGPYVLAQAAPPARAGSPPAPVTRVARSQAESEDSIYQELNRQYDQFQQVNRTFELVAKAVSPAVVHIVARKTGRREDNHSYQYEETGSGVIVRAERSQVLYVLTNNHVVEGANTGDVNIFLQDGRVIHPSRFWTDGMADIAVLKLSRTDLPAARLGNSDQATVGSWVLALGSPFGLTHSVTQGIISARGRHERELQEVGVDNQDFLQTDAAINPGNSGGPLVNLRGEVIGINTAIASNGGGSEGVGFSIPINLARWIMGQLIATGKVSRGALGVELDDLTADQAQAQGLERPHGAVILSVHPSSPAAKAGVHDGDVIVRFNGAEVADLNQLINLVSMAPIGQPADLIIWRDHKEMGLAVTVANRDEVIASAITADDRTNPKTTLHRPKRPNRPTPHNEDSVSDAPDLGLELLTLDAPSARRLGLPDTLRGVAVSRVEATSPLAAHLQPLDVIYAIDKRQVRTADEVALALAHRADGQAPLEIWLQRLVDGAVQRRAVRLP